MNIIVNVMIKAASDLDEETRYINEIRGPFTQSIRDAIVRGKDPTRVLEFLAALGHRAIHTSGCSESDRKLLASLTGENEAPTIH